MNKNDLMNMDKEKLADYVLLLLDTIVDLEGRLQSVYEYTNRMSYAPVVDNPKKDIIKRLKRVDTDD